MIEVYWLTFIAIINTAFFSIIKIRNLKKQNQEKQNKINELNIQAHQSSQEIIEKNKQIAIYDLENNILKEEKYINQDLKQQNIQLHMKVTELEAEKKSLIEREKTIHTSCENIANKIIHSKTNEFTKMAQKDIFSALNPLKDQIHNFQKLVTNSAKDSFNLKNEVKALEQSNKELSNALKGNNKIIGNWGETILQRILELSGLKKGIDYVSQVGQESRPDYIIKLPENKQLVIDVKTTFKSYEDYINANSEEDRKKHANSLAKSIKTSIKNLASKEYLSINQINSLDFIIMFMPIDNAFSIVMQQDSDMYRFAWDNGIIITCPSSILAILSVIKLMWRVKNQELHAEEIAEKGGKIYDKIANFITYMDKLESSLSSALNKFTDAKKALYGKDSVLKNAEKLKEMGVKNKKSISWETEDD